ncbi:MAG TPA: hypothetical protein IAB21_03130 [Candidatus Avelusimicrobium excrementipullorum]|nr:hypothetical protein [Candidatus Avelusimicrobium excrementipullorum]
MKKLAVLFCLGLLAGAVWAAAEQKKPMKIKMTFNGREAVLVMQENAAVAQLAELLPAEFTFRDFAGEEKITDFPRPLDLSAAPRGMVAAAGRVFIYAPWGNMGIFYKEHGSKMDKSLIWLGDVQSGLEDLAAQKRDFRARLEIMK